MAKLVKCSLCGTPKWKENRHFKENLMKYRIETVEQLNKVYVCRNCRPYRKPTHLKRTTEFKAFQKQVQEIINEYIHRGWNNIEAEQFCRTNIEALLAKHHIGPTHFRVMRNGHAIKGFVLLDIPFWNNFLVEVEWKE